MVVWFSYTGTFIFASKGPAAPSEFSVRKWNAIQKVKRERSKLEQQQQPPNAVATDDSSSGNMYGALNFIFKYMFRFHRM